MFVSVWHTRNAHSMVFVCEHVMHFKTVQTMILIMVNARTLYHAQTQSHANIFDCDKCTTNCDAIGIIKIVERRVNYLWRKLNNVKWIVCVFFLKMRSNSKQFFPLSFISVVLLSRLFSIIPLFTKNTCILLWYTNYSNRKQ